LIAVKENKKAKGVFKDLANELKRKEAPAWLQLDKNKLEAKTIGEPNLDEVKPPAEISLIFEFYSR
jgi:ribosomal protein S4